jgi:hypothetical protein
MNSRIRELADQCWSHRVDGALVDGQLHFDHEKFAELIVQECANKLIEWKDEPFPYDPEFGARLIKQHFGIK